MSVDWKAYAESAMKTLGNLAKGNPKLMEGVKGLAAAGKATGALDGKTRELISLAVAATTRCDTCLALHAKAAVAAGATRDEVLEALAVAVAMNAGAAMTYSSHVLEAYDTFAK